MVLALSCPVSGICSDHCAGGGGGGCRGGVVGFVLSPHALMRPHREVSALTEGSRQSGAGYLVGYFESYPA